MKHIHKLKEKYLILPIEAKSKHTKTFPLRITVERKVSDYLAISKFLFWKERNGEIAFLVCSNFLNASYSYQSHYCNPRFVPKMSFLVLGGRWSLAAAGSTPRTFYRCERKRYAGLGELFLRVSFSVSFRLWRLRGCVAKVPKLPKVPKKSDMLRA